MRGCRPWQQQLFSLQTLAQSAAASNLGENRFPILESGESYGMTVEECFGVFQTQSLSRKN